MLLVMTLSLLFDCLRSSTSITRNISLRGYFLLSKILWFTAVILFISIYRSRHRKDYAEYRRFEKRVMAKFLKSGKDRTTTASSTAIFDEEFLRDQDLQLFLQAILRKKFQLQLPIKCTMAIVYKVSRHLILPKAQLVLLYSPSARQGVFRKLPLRDTAPRLLLGIE